MKFIPDDIYNIYLINANTTAYPEYREVKVIELTKDREFVKLRYLPMDYYCHTEKTIWEPNSERDFCVLIKENENKS